MAFLDNSGDIILDAVLTDTGRFRLAKGDGSFKITKFALGDDEIDYSLITKYGVVVGKEKIEKNTPIFEASTNKDFGVKSYLRTASNPLVAQPVISVTVQKTTLVFNDNTQKTTSIGLSMLRSDALETAVTYQLNYDSNFVSPTSGYTGTPTVTIGSRRFITINSNNVSGVQNIVFEIQTAGKAILEEAGQTVTSTIITVSSSNGDEEIIPITIDYQGSTP